MMLVMMMMIASWAKQTRLQAPRRPHSPWSLGKAENLSAGMWQLSVLWLTPTYIRQLRPLEVLRILLPPGRKPSTQIFPAATSSNHWHLRLWVHWVLALLHLLQSLVAVYHNLLTTHVRQLFCSSACQSLFKGSTQFWCRKPLIFLTASRTSSFSSFCMCFKLFFSPREPLLPRA